MATANSQTASQIRNTTEAAAAAVRRDSNLISTASTSGAAATVERVGRHTLQWGLVLVLVWIGGMKFTNYEAQGISGLVQNSPLMSWCYSILSIRQFSAALGIVEIVIAMMIAARAVAPRVSAVGAAMAIGMFATTLSFMVTTPGVFEPQAGGFPAISVIPGQFLLKDAVLLGASILLLGESLKAITAR